MSALISLEIPTIKTNVIFFRIYTASRDKTGGTAEYNADESVSYTAPFTSFLMVPCPKLNVLDILLEEQKPAGNPYLEEKPQIIVMS